MASGQFMVCQAEPETPVMYNQDTGPRMPPKAPNPKAPAPGGSYLSFSSAETLTPESSAGGRPSRASAVGSCLGTGTPQSRPSAAEYYDRLSVGKVSVQSSVGDLSEEASDAADVLGQRRFRHRPSELRRRKYRAPGSTLQHLQLPSCGDVSSASGSSWQKTPEALPVAPGCLGEGDSSGSRSGPSIPSVSSTAHGSASAAVMRSVSSSDMEDSEVLVEGPLQERFLGMFWRWRWCVLDHQHLKIYRDEEASLLMPEKPLEVYCVADLYVASDLHQPALLACTSSSSGDPVLFLRTGHGQRWEDFAAASLWLRAFASASGPAIAGVSRDHRRSTKSSGAVKAAYPTGEQRN
mmetsp:Transcript_70834/g.125061  ORF Transcript_70834/g.125061 Transcript_70834/m.125061 type:complete len:351 (-) Transcript_70834:155-1207(-)|eukprot:CAMPEP_0197664390 /NCGR_PEP_ID=MMETSP1338-20131121/58607_1 /TAXON_ID=43686 ORGANISM="Pelagodinium beii, Strain RCC1491" /NCGR_SAMPLE_ID=MMETSP1338 /ASSEMBLY_ACC=CAM_ASM_000754 /LENGTH=350 /DNA_ID=CAMNT_0043243017 /DNA_START=33 /DNA_END=1085 /DNA_ORIENTATION=-